LEAGRDYDGRDELERQILPPRPKAKRTEKVD
jgi:hypothetical protein